MNESIVDPTRRGPAAADSQGVNVCGIVPPQVRLRAIAQAKREGVTLSKLVWHALEAYLAAREA
jgi:hypothetical protein